MPAPTCQTGLILAPSIKMSLYICTRSARYLDDIRRSCIIIIISSIQRLSCIIIGCLFYDVLIKNYAIIGNVESVLSRNE